LTCGALDWYSRLRPAPSGQPFGISLELRTLGAAVTASRLEREFNVPTDDLGSKAESARIAFEEPLCCLAQAGRFRCRAPGDSERCRRHRAELLKWPPGLRRQAPESPRQRQTTARFRGAKFRNWPADARHVVSTPLQHTRIVDGRHGLTLYR